MGSSSTFAVALLLFGALSASPAQAQTSAEGAYLDLSPANQAIAHALYEAQTARTTGTTTKPLTLDQIAALKQSGKGWGEIFNAMKAKGLVTDKNLGRVVSRYHRPASTGAVTTAPNRVVPKTRPEYTFDAAAGGGASDQTHASARYSDAGTPAGAAAAMAGGNGVGRR